MIKKILHLFVLSAFAAVAVMQALPESQPATRVLLIGAGVLLLFAGHAVRLMIESSAELGDYAYGGKLFDRRMGVLVTFSVTGLILAGIGANILAATAVPCLFLWALLLLTVASSISACVSTKRRYDAR